jgi:hypothetical protein
VASGKKRAVLARHVRNRRLYDAIDQWGFCAISASPGARAFYDHHVRHEALDVRGEVKDLPRSVVAAAGLKLGAA